MNILRLSTYATALAIAVLTLGYANPSFAAKPDCDLEPLHPSCKDDGGGGGNGGGSDGDATYSVVFVEGDMSVESGVNHPWSAHSRGIHPGGRQNALATMIDLSYFSFLGQCGFGGVTNATGALIEKSKKDMAEAWFWFDAFTTTAQPGRYLVQTFGTITTSPSGWLPTDPNQPALLTMNSWAMLFENGQPELEEFACLGDSDALGIEDFEYSFEVYLNQP